MVLNGLFKPWSHRNQPGLRNIPSRDRRGHQRSSGSGTRTGPAILPPSGRGFPRILPESVRCTRCGGEEGTLLRTSREAYLSKTAFNVKHDLMDGHKPDVLTRNMRRSKCFATETHPSRRVLRRRRASQMVAKVPDADGPRKTQASLHIEAGPVGGERP